MDIFGVDLSGPGSPERTAVARFRVSESGLHALSLRLGATDVQIADAIGAAPCVVGVDAPLSYNPTGGSRPSDAELRERAVEAGLPAGSVMAPSAPRMAYLTLRGISLTRLLQQRCPSARPVEVHPTAALVLRGAPADLVRAYKRSEEARTRLLAWLRGKGLRDVEARVRASDHAVAACAAALAAWQWYRGESCWLYPADPPVHPYDFAC